VDNRTVHGRRYLRCDLTWHGIPDFTSDLVDILIAQTEENCLSSKETWQPGRYNPFGVFPVHRQTDISNAERSSALLMRPLLVDTTSSSEERFLFHHYVTHVAQIMMPFEDTRNPWLVEYPAVAIARGSNEQKALYSGVLAHAAFNLVHLYGDRYEWASYLAAKHYDNAISLVTTSIKGASRDNGGLQAAIMTLMMAEVCIDIGFNCFNEID